MHRFFPFWLEHFGHLEHVASFWPHRHQPNVLFVHYNDLKADLSGEMRRIAEFLQLDVADDLFQACVDRCTFEKMREDPERMGKFDLFEGGLKGFIFKGTNRRWKNVLNAEALVLYERRVAAQLPADAAAWMQHGGHRD